MATLAALRWPDLDSGPTGTLLAVPLGATEQHGPHLPFDTDTTVAEALCAGLAARRADTVVAPAVPYGASGEHQGFPGTLSIGRAAMELVVVELVRSATVTFPRVLLVSAHGGNTGPVRAAVARLSAESRDVMAYFPQPAGDAHAGCTETSLMLALRPAAVVDPGTVSGDPRPLADLMPALRAGRLRELSPTGVLGAPAAASAGRGRALLAGLLDELAARVAARWPTSGARG